MGPKTQRRRLFVALLSAGLALSVVADPAAGAQAGTVAPADRPPPGRPLVMTEHGPVLGVTTPEVQQFLGIPYAAPPVGPRRWRPPAPPAPWATPRDASQ